jgi:hypothetical protein
MLALKLTYARKNEKTMFNNRTWNVWNDGC